MRSNGWSISGYGVHPYVHDGWWIDTGAPGDLLEANDLVLEEIAYGIEGYVDRDSTVGRRVTIAAGRGNHQQRRARPVDHRRKRAHCEQLHRPLHQH